jgi:hypothetical protein
MSDLVVIAFPTEAKAEEVRQKLLAMQNRGEGQQRTGQTESTDQYHGFWCGYWH